MSRCLQSFVTERTGSILLTKGSSCWQLFPKPLDLVEPMGKVRGFFFVLVLAGSFNIFGVGYVSSDGLEPLRGPLLPVKAVNSYKEAIEVWKTPEDIARWIAAHFSYDRERAKELSETNLTNKGQPPVYDPSELFDRKTGVCVDLSRFAVETLKGIDPDSQPKYLMIEFDPIEVEGHWPRRHWLVSFRREGKIFFFADSERPGHIAGPFNTVLDFIQDYGRYRGRKILHFEELNSYQKKRKTKALKRQSQLEPLGSNNPSVRAALLSIPSFANGKKTFPSSTTCERKAERHEDHKR